jgi:flagellar M-ring protein FliF
VTALDADFAKNLTARARSAMIANPRVATVAIGAIAATAVVAVFLWSRDPAYSVLYAGLSGEEGGRAIAELQKLNIPYQITEGGRVIMVPSGELGQARLALAARGVPKQGGDDWGLLDNESLGVSPFVEQVHYNRGLEATLSHTVGEVEGVLSAQVALALPKRTGFISDEPKPSASVLLRLAPGAHLSAAQVAGVVGLVASSVPGLAKDDVTVVDQDGKVLSAPGGNTALGQIPAQFAIVEQINDRYARLIDDLLAPVVGSGNYRVTVDTDIDFSQSKQSFVRYGPSHILSQDQTTREGGGDVPVGIPGALSNRPPANPTAQTPPAAQPAQPAPPPAAGAAVANAAAAAPAAPPKEPAPPVPKESHSVTNYDIDKTVQYLEDPPWRLHAISVAVLLNNASGKAIPAERVKSIKTLVESVIGVGESRAVTVVDLPFNREEAPPAPPTVWWKEPWVHEAARNGAIAIAGLFALFGGLFPILRWLRSRPAAAAASPFAVLAAAGAIGAAGGIGGARLMPGAPGMAQPGGGGARTSISSNLDLSGVSGDAFKVDVDEVRKIVANDPGRTAQVIKEWISRGSRNKP